MKAILKNILLFSFITYAFYFIAVKFYLFPRHSAYGAQIILSIENEKNYAALPSVDYLILGDSSAFKNIIPAAISPESFSLALPGGSTMDIYHRLDRIDLNKIKEGIILTNSFIAPKHYDRDYWDRMVLFGFYSFSEFMENYDIGKTNNIFPSAYSKPAYLFYYAKSKLLLSTRGLQALWYAPASFQQKISVAESIRERFTKGKGWLDNPEGIRSPIFFKAYNTHYSKRFKADPTDDYFMRQILKYTFDRNIPVYFIQGPLSEKGHLMVEVDEYKATIAQYMKALEEKYPNFHYYQSELKPPPKEFFDFYHLNVRGAIRFSGEISDYLKERINKR